MAKETMRQHKVINCDYCNKQEDDFHPSHDASPRCESGGRNHCTCDICW